MDTTTALIIFIFVISILGGARSNKVSQAPVAPTFPTGTVYNEVSVLEPPPNFAAAGLNAQSSIQNHIAKYRSPSEAAQIADSIMRHSMTYDTNPKLVAALMTRESKFNPRAVSSSGAIGLGQLLPSTAKGLNIDDPFDIDQNAKGTVRYIKSLIDRFKGKVSNALAGYLEGPNAVMRQGGYSAHTRTYVEDILSIYQKI